MSEKTALVVMVKGTEESEAVIAIDVLRRAGITVTVAGLESAEPIKCNLNTVITPDAALADVKDKPHDLIVVPGGEPGSGKLADSSLLGALLHSQHTNGRYIGAICAGPLSLVTNKIAPGATVTSYASIKDKMTEAGYKYSDEKVVVSDNIVTSQGPGTAFQFSVKLAELLAGEEKAKEVADALLVKCC